jgi:transcriptional regulator with XRE-family HTH domain
MTDIKKKIAEVAEKDKSKWLEKAKYRRENRDWLLKSKHIALRVLGVLKERGMQQKELAEQLGVSKQQVSKIVKGKENLTLETISKLEKALGITLFEIPSQKSESEQQKKPAKSQADQLSKLKESATILSQIEPHLIKYLQVAMDSEEFVARESVKKTFIDLLDEIRRDEIKNNKYLFSYLLSNVRHQYINTVKEEVRINFSKDIPSFKTHFSSKVTWSQAKKQVWESPENKPKMRLVG